MMPTLDNVLRDAKNIACDAAVVVHPSAGFILVQMVTSDPVAPSEASLLALSKIDRGCGKRSMRLL